MTTVLRMNLQDNNLLLSSDQTSGIQPIIKCLENEDSDLLIAAITDNNLDYQFALAGDHHLNPVERAIQSFKNHLISILKRADALLLTYQWDRLVYQ